eukprot:COSAG06_NODE_3978_length_4693_cov_11.594906_6_plen_42_part_00
MIGTCTWNISPGATPAGMVMLSICKKKTHRSLFKVLSLCLC